MLTLFRVVALVEGASLIAFAILAALAKTTFGIPTLVVPTAILVGATWSAYWLIMTVVFARMEASIGVWTLTSFASVIPFAPFLNDRFVRRIGVPR